MKKFVRKKTLENILGFNQYMKLDKILYILYADFDSLIKNIDNCKNNLEKFSTIKIVKHITCTYIQCHQFGYSII